MSVVIYTILKRARAVGRITSLRRPPLINSLTIGSAPYAALPKICLKKLRPLSGNDVMCFFIIIGLFLVVIGLGMLLIYWPAWPTGVTLIGVGLVVAFLFGWAYKKIFADKIDRGRKV